MKDTKKLTLKEMDQDTGGEELANAPTIEDFEEMIAGHVAYVTSSDDDRVQTIRIPRTIRLTRTTRGTAISRRPSYPRC